jgi:hypothetical protein
MNTYKRHWGALPDAIGSCHEIFVKPGIRAETQRRDPCFRQPQAPLADALSRDDVDTIVTVAHDFALEFPACLALGDLDHFSLDEPPRLYGPTTNNPENTERPAANWALQNNEIQRQKFTQLQFQVNGNAEVSSA